MTTHTVAPPRVVGFSTDALRREPAYQAFTLLRIGFTVAPIVFGLDKFFNVLVNWEIYLAPWVNRLIPGTAHQLMDVVGVVEILAGVAVAIKPRYGACLVAAWLAGIVPAGQHLRPAVPPELAHPRPSHGLKLGTVPDSLGTVPDSRPTGGAAGRRRRASRRAAHPPATEV